MSPVNDMRTELRRLAGSKPVHAAAGAGVVASEVLRELPARVAKWRADSGLGSLETLEKRASGYLTEVRSHATHSYDHLALRGKKALGSRPAPKGKGALNGKGTAAR